MGFSAPDDGAQTGEERQAVLSYGGSVAVWIVTDAEELPLRKSDAVEVGSAQNSVWRTFI